MLKIRRSNKNLSAHQCQTTLASAVGSICTVVGLSLSLGAASSAFNTAVAASIGDLPVSAQGQWVYQEDPEYTYAKGSASKSWSVKEAVPHHELAITVQDNMINSYTFKVSCMLESATPMMELRVSSLDIRLYDSINDFVYARFMVDDNQEYSLRGDLVSSDKIVFLPLTQGQDKTLSDLFLQMREGGQLKIGLLQGNRAKVREYTVPLAGFIRYSDQILQSCQSYNQYFQGEHTFLPDYMAKEPDGYAPKDYSLKQEKNEVIDPFAPAPVPEEPTPAPEVEVEQTAVHHPPEIIPFTPGGGPASIGPDGMPIGVNGNNVGGSSGQNVEQSLGTAQGPMQIGPDGMPIPADGANATVTANTNNANGGGAGAAATATANGQNAQGQGQGQNGDQQGQGNNNNWFEIF